MATACSSMPLAAIGTRCATTRPTIFRPTGGTPSITATRTPTATPWRTPLGEMAAAAETMANAAMRPAARRRKNSGAAYFRTFFDPATGVLAGWRSADGQLHDYYFLYVSGIAVDYGLVPRDQAGRLWTG